MSELMSMAVSPTDVINLNTHPLANLDYRNACKNTLDETGVLVLNNFLQPKAVESLIAEGNENRRLAYYTTQNHNIYLQPRDPQFDSMHPRNREITSSKGCITTDQIPTGSVLHSLYKGRAFREFLCSVLNETELFEYADPLSSINLHYADEGQELGWHFDNSSFAITLLIQKPEAGGDFEYVKHVRDADSGEMNYALAASVLDGDVAATQLTMEPGALVLFRGRNSMHRVTPTQGDTTRMLVVLAYNTEPNISLSESARQTFYGRLGN